MPSSFQHIKNVPPNDATRGRFERPSFSSQITTDRLRESERRSSSAQAPTKLKQQRRSVFKEEGLDDLDHAVYHPPEVVLAPVESEVVVEEQEKERSHVGVTFDDILKDIPPRENDEHPKKQNNMVWLSKLSKGSRPMIKSSASAPPGTLFTLTRSALIVTLIAVCIPSFQYYGNDKVIIGGADATPTMSREKGALEARQDTDTSTCTRWANQGKLRERESEKTD